MIQPLFLTHDWSPDLIGLIEMSSDLIGLIEMSLALTIIIERFPLMEMSLTSFMRAWNRNKIPYANELYSVAYNRHF